MCNSHSRELFRQHQKLIKPATRNLVIVLRNIGWLKDKKFIPVFNIIAVNEFFISLKPVLQSALLDPIMVSH